jgi:Ca-activated chloride channel homolog
MHFGSPLYFWCFLLLPVLAGFFIYAYQRRQVALSRFAGMQIVKRLVPGTGMQRRVIKWALLAAAFFFLTLALVRPRFGVKMEMVERQGVDVVVALDISQSMLAQDIAPNRLDRAKHEIAKFMDLLKGDRIGLVIFAGESYVLCPLTLDYGAAAMFLDGVSTDWITLQGTDLSGAITRSAQAYKSAGRKHKVLLLLSDGEDWEGDPVIAAKAAADQGVRIYTVGLGSESGVPIPVSKPGDNVAYKKDNSGNPVMTRLNAVMLEKIAIEGNGKYFHAGTDLDLSQIYTEIAAMEKKDFGANKVGVYEERYQIFLLLALVCFLAEFCIPERTKRKEEWKGRLV